MNWFETDQNSLSGTAYVELLPGRYRDVCWNAGSLFFNEERFGHIEPTIEVHVPNYDHYAFSEVDRVAWRAVLTDLSQLQSLLKTRPQPAELRGRIGFFFRDSEANFMRDLPRNSTLLAEMIRELDSWVRAQLEEHEVITILGL